MLASPEWSQDVARHLPLQGSSFISSPLTPNVPSAGLRCSVPQQGGRVRQTLAGYLGWGPALTSLILELNRWKMMNMEG